MTLVGVDDLKEYMGNPAFNSAQAQAADRVLTGLQRQLERYINRPLEPTLVQERVEADTDGYLQLSMTPIVSLISITDARGNLVPVDEGATVPALAQDEFDQFGAVQQVDYVGGTFRGGSTITYGGFGGGVAARLIPGNWYVVKYVAKEADYALDDARVAILRAGAREMTRMHDDTLSLKDGTFNDDPNPQIVGINGFGLTTAELAQFDRARRRVIV